MMSIVQHVTNELKKSVLCLCVRVRALTCCFFSASFFSRRLSIAWCARGTRIICNRSMESVIHLMLLMEMINNVDRLCAYVLFLTQSLGECLLSYIACLWTRKSSIFMLSLWVINANILNFVITFNLLKQQRRKKRGKKTRH